MQKTCKTENEKTCFVISRHARCFRVFDGKMPRTVWCTWQRSCRGCRANKTYCAARVKFHNCFEHPLSLALFSQVFLIKPKFKCRASLIFAFRIRCPTEKKTCTASNVSHVYREKHRTEQLQTLLIFLCV